MTREEFIELANTARFDPDPDRASDARVIIHDALLEILPETYPAVLRRAEQKLAMMKVYGSDYGHKVRVVVDPEALVALFDEAGAASAFRIDVMVGAGPWRRSSGRPIDRLDDRELVTFSMTGEEWARARAARDGQLRKPAAGRKR